MASNARAEVLMLQQLCLALLDAPAIVFSWLCHAADTKHEQGRCQAAANGPNQQTLMSGMYKVQPVLTKLEEGRPE